MRNFVYAALCALMLGVSFTAMAAEPINVNEAPVESLMSLPGIGEVKAQAIVDEREANGEYASLDELTRVDGIGDTTVSNLSEAATF